MKPSLVVLLSLIIALLSGRAWSIEAQTADCLHEWNIDQMPPGALPTQFSIGTLFDGRPADDWQALTTDRAKSPPNVLAQLMPKGAEHAYKVVLLKGTESATWNWRSRCSPLGERVIWGDLSDVQPTTDYRVVKGVRAHAEKF